MSTASSRTTPAGPGTDPLDTVLARAATAAEPARRSVPAERARWLEAVAAALDAAAARLVPLAHGESHLPEGRLSGELGRTTFQCRLFAERLGSGALDDVRVDHADADWPMGARPDIRRTTVPLGPVLVFAASNFPFAFSVMGGDTVSALAAGCPVVVKAHPGHPELSRLTAAIATEALEAAGAPPHLLQLVEGEQGGADAVRDHRVKAVGFTGSTRGGRYLFDLAMGRPDPIPFYGELGSTNPVVVTPAGWAERPGDIAAGFAASCTLGSGQFCTQPGVVFVPDADAFFGALPPLTAGPMLGERIAAAYASALDDLAARDRVCTALRRASDDGHPDIALLRTTTDAVLDDPSLIATEVFGPASIFVEYGDLAEVEAVLAGFEGALTGTVQGGDALDADGRRLLDVLAGRVGRVIWNQWPTGVTVSDAQQHGGPWPASTAPGTTSVGTAAIDRFRRPVAFQNVPGPALPPEIRDR
ncbi:MULTISPECIES: aldehyde dehydrogenase (NADP(+)) [unclassified Streptomyces]|uniref:aldehyde dehydrogenase (NADP(+)) n=1 Tax=unclassified Streptomyces TaxID=2593676 RepID=UPI002DD927F4|nr:aldehyde dehydrogenase (NADP(+)) [Streptomyces sp. NBC_01775]WSB81265.1 aldehyde dehydrogenase (NADP(+)) [Streptomyces sp. NBC_01775]WSS39221.1 aldehyde dehydrogenase (NADP(+)) [Streptomyces sp. NBC_01187]